MIVYDAKPFWSAATFYRRAANRDRRKSILILEAISKAPKSKTKSRAETLLKEIRNVTEQPSNYEG